MAFLTNAVNMVHPSFVEPELIMPINQASGAFDLLPDGKPAVKLGAEDLAVYEIGRAHV